MLPPIPTFQARFGPCRFVMAPMAGITDIIFRSLIRELGAEIVVSELISSEGLVRGGQRTLELIRFHESERPVGIQLFGYNIASMASAAKIVEQMGADFVDINFGCPVKKVVCDGGGAAWLKNPLELAKLLREMKSAIQIPLSIKIRTGWDDQSINAKEIIDIAAQEGVEWVAIHGRTRAQGYSGQADWELIRKVAQSSPIPIIGNGDILTAAEGRRKLEEGYAHAIMIGRGALKNPWIFQELKATSPIERDYTKLVRRHFELATEWRGKNRAFLSLKKFLAWYAVGYPGASNFRKAIFSTSNIDELKNLALDFFHTHGNVDKALDTQPFLMGGHG